MSRFLKIIVMPVLIILFMGEAHAGYKYQYSGVKRYYPSGDNVYIIPIQKTINPAGCRSSSYYVVEHTHPNFEEYKKLILSAKMSGYKLGMYVYDNTCVGSYSKIYRMFIQ